MVFRKILMLGIFLGLSCYGIDTIFLLRDVESGKIVQKEGDIEQVNSPFSTCKLALSVMGYDSHILIDEELPIWEYRPENILGEGVVFPFWKKSHTPTEWIQNSCVWFSQKLTKELGKKAFGRYIAAFKYGNQNISGDEGKDNGLTNAWLNSSLQISPLEQTDFINRLLKNELPVSLYACEMTRNIFFVENLPDGWKLFGKTGSGVEKNISLGWFVGWLEKKGQKLSFAYLLKGENSEETLNGSMAKDLLKEKIFSNVFLCNAHEAKKSFF